MCFVKGGKEGSGVSRLRVNTGCHIFSLGISWHPSDDLGAICSQVFHFPHINTHYYPDGP